MLEGLEIVEITLSKLRIDNWTFRIDSEFLKKNFLQNIQTIKLFSKGFIKLKEHIDFMSGGATPLGAEYSEKGIPFLRVQNIMQNYFNLNDIVYLNEKQDKEIKRSRLKENDVLLTITGVSYGKSVVVPKQLENSNINQHSVKITLNKDLNPYFLSTFLNCKFGKLQSDKNIVGVTRPALDYEVIRNFIIPQLNLEFQKSIETLITKAYSVEHQSKKTYHQAETLLLETLGLKDFEPSSEAVNIKSFKESFGTSGRLDAEYYQKKYEEYTKLIKNYKHGFRLIKNLCNLKDNNFNPDKIKEYQYIELSDIGNAGNIMSCTLAKGEELPSRARRLVQANDVIISSIEGSLNSCALVTNNYTDALCSTGFYVINSDKINSETLLVLFKTEVMQNILKQNCSGTILTAINKSEFQNIPIPIIDYAIQQEIATLVEESFRLKQESDELLETAKRAVELAIEEGEEAAIKYINQYT